MAWFSRRTPSTLVPVIVLEQLGDFGRASFEARVRGCAVDDPRFEWNNFLGQFLPAYQSNFTQAIAELHAAASDDPFARFGGSRVVAEFDGASKEPLYLDMIDGGLQLMFDRGLSSGNLTGYETDRWIQTHGDLRESFDRIVDVAVPENPEVRVSLRPGQNLMVAKMGPNPMDNEFHIERIDDQTYGAFSMRERESGDGTHTRCEEREIQQSSNVADLLRALGEYLRRPPYWAHDELQPYFPERRNL